MRRQFVQFFALAAVGAALIAPATSPAQNTLGIYADFGEGLEPSMITKPGVPFDIVVELESDDDVLALEFVMTELMHLYSGVFKLSTDKVNDTFLDLGDNQLGEYFMATMGCVASGVTEIVRIRYYDLNGEIGEDTVLQLRGFHAGDTRPSSFGGSMGYVTCASQKVWLTGAPWNPSSGVDPLRIPGVEETDGLVVLNPATATVSTGSTSVGMVKSRF